MLIINFFICKKKNDLKLLCKKNIYKDNLIYK